MLARIKPVLQSLIPGRPADARVTELKPWVRGVVTAYVCTIVPVLVLSTVLMVAHAPRAVATAYDSAGVQWDRIAAAPGVAAATAGIVQLTLLVLPSLGMVLTSGRVGGRVCRSAWCWSEGEPLRRGVLGVGTLAAAGIAAFIWWPNGDYRPIQPTERGTVQAAVHDLRALPTGRPALTPQRERELGGAPTERQRRRAQLPPDAGSPAKQSTPKRTTSTSTTPSATATSTTDTTTTPTDTTVTETVPGASTPTTPTDATPTAPPPGTTTPAPATPPAGATTTPAPATPAAGTTTTTTTPAPPVTTTP
jgi:putative peptide zinc metalloprotease protein